MKNRIVILFVAVAVLLGLTSFYSTASAFTYYIYNQQWVGASVSGQLGPYFTGDSIALRSDGSACTGWTLYQYHIGYYPAHNQSSLDYVSPEFYKNYEIGGCRTISLRDELAGQPAGSYVLAYPAGYSGYNNGTPSFCAFDWDGTIADISGCGLAKNPVLIVPGLMGTEMKNSSELLWSDLDRMFRDVGDNFIDPLGFNLNLSPSNSYIAKGDIIKKLATAIGLGDFDYTLSLINEFTAQGYIENQNLFTFPHDWRYGASGKYPDGKTNSDLLGEKIQAIMSQTGSDKVDVIAHSQGGLIVKKYVADHVSDHHIGKAVFVGVPSTGAPKSVKVLLQGDHFGIPWLSEAEIKKISENMPAAYDLLPSQQYYDQKGSFVKVVDEGTLGGLTPPTNKDLNYGEFGSFLTTDHALNSQALINAVALHTQAFDNFDMRIAGVDLYAIDGCKAGTLGTVVENRYKNVFGQSFVDYKAPQFTPGDGTVPLESATNLPIDIDHKFYSLAGEHSKMLSQDGSRQEIVNLLSGSDLEVKPELITQNIDECELNGKAISVFSPIDIFVTDQNGNHLGNAADGSVVNEIPNAGFEVFGEHKFLYLPTGEGQTYNISMDGTGTGTYTIKSDDIENGQLLKTQVFSNLAVTPNLTGSMNLGSTQDSLMVRQTTASQPETILPSAIVVGDDIEDVLPPITAAVLSGTVGQVGFYRSDVNVAFNATDDNSGVLALNYNIDGTGYQKVLANSVNLVIAKEGNHTINFFATDKAGNNEQEQTVTFTIDKTAPEAVIEFDPMVKDLKFLAFNDQEVIVTDSDNVVTLTDQAGNVTEITLKSKDRKKSMSAEIKSLKYNGVMSDITKNIMQYKWKLDKQKNITELTQHVKSKKDYNVFADFDGKNTKFEGKDAGGKISKLVAGLKIIKILTDKGDFGWSY